MTEERMALVDLLPKSGDGDVRRAVAENMLQILTEADVERLIGIVGICPSQASITAVLLQQKMRGCSNATTRSTGWLSLHRQ